jgi:ElaB/YqjD/DUF883 family membrane-anchored ribosome-binding protein
LQKREKELKQLSNRLQFTTKQLEELQRSSGSFSDEEEARIRQIEARLENEKRQLQGDLKDIESQYARLEIVKRGLEGENKRLLISLTDKEKELKVSVLLKFS